MDEMILAIIAGSLIPAIALITKKLVIDKVFNNINREIEIKTSSGKTRNYIINGKADEKIIIQLLESEINFELVVEKYIKNYINKSKHKDLSLSDGSHVDFILEINGKKVAVEAKENLDHFKANWAKNYLSDNKDINDIIFIVNSKISTKVMNNIENAIGSRNVKFISSPDGRGLNESLKNLLNTELKISRKNLKSFS